MVFAANKIPLAKKLIEEKKAQVLPIPNENYNHKFQLDLVKTLIVNNFSNYWMRIIRL